VRILAGAFKRTPLAVADRPGLRPTPERVRETVFDWLTHLTGGDWQAVRALDMFSGSGAMALECVSRGAARAVAIEKDRAGARAIAATVEKLGARDRLAVVCGDALLWTKGALETFDIVFIDPPFASRLQLAAAKAALNVLAPGGLIYLESEELIADEALGQTGLTAVRRGKAGAVHYLLAKAA
jgi:16S rRNA (guanine(966)-N(2))-methyltransferase RsmD